MNDKKYPAHAHSPAHAHAAVKKKSPFAAVLCVIAALAAVAVIAVMLLKKDSPVAILPSPSDTPEATAEPAPEASPEPVELRKYVIDRPETGSAAVDGVIDRYVRSMTDAFNAEFTQDDDETLTVSVTGFAAENAYSCTFSCEYTGFSGSEYHCLSLEDGHEMTVDEALGENIRRYLWNYFDYSLPDLADLTGPLADGAEAYISADESNFNSFMLNEDGSVSLTFGAGTLNASEAVTLTAGSDVVSGEFWNTRHIRADRPMVALTFDDGPSEEFSAQIYACLDRYHAVATFFDVGQRVDKWPELEKMGYDLGNEMASHTYWHSYLDSYDYDALAYDRQLVNEAFVNAIGVEPSLVRPPEGKIGGAALGSYNELFIGWSVDTLDWLTRNAQSSLQTVQEFGDLDGQVILLHSIYPESAEAAELIIPWLVEQGYQLVTVSELLKYGYELDPPDAHYYYAYDFFIGGRPKEE